MSRSPLIPIFLIVFVDVLGLTLMIPLLPFYARDLGASKLETTLLFAVFAACQLIAGPIIGRISDRVGRRPTLIVSQIGTFAGFIMLGLADHLWMLFVGRAIDGLTAGNLSVAQAYISDVTRPEDRTKAFGFIGIAFGVGFLLGPAISGILSDAFGYHVPAFAAAALSLTSILCTYFLLPEVERATPIESSLGRLARFTQYLRKPASRQHLFEFFFFTLSFSMMFAGMGIFLADRLNYSASDVGWLFAYTGLIGALIQGGLLGRLVKRLGESRLSQIGFVTMGIGSALLGAIYGLPMLIIATTIGGFGSAVTRPALTTLVTRSVGRHEQGAILGVNQSMASVAQMLGPVIAGVLLENNLYTMFGFVVGGFAFVGAALALRRGDHQPVEPIESPIT